MNNENNGGNNTSSNNDQKNMQNSTTNNNSTNQVNINSNTNTNPNPMQNSNNISNMGQDVKSKDINSTGQGSNINNMNNNSSTFVNEKLKEVSVNYTPPSKAKTFGMVFMFILIIAFVIFLPDITTMVNKYKASKLENFEEVITTGKLECSLKTNTSNLDIDYFKVFKYTDNKLESADYTTTTKGDIELDAETLNEINDKCQLLKDYTSKVDGISVKCNFSKNKLEEKQSYDFSKFSKEEVETAFTEVGGTYPDYNVGDSIDNIEKNMNAAGYTCIRKK